MEGRTPVSRRGRSRPRARLAAVVLARTVLLCGAVPVFVFCRQLKMQTFDSITGDFSQEFGVAEITPAQLRARRRTPAPTLYIDVRTPQEQSVSIIPGAVRVTPADDLLGRAELQKFLREHKGDSAAMVVVYCAGGYRSARSLGRLDPALRSDTQAVQIRNLRGGIIAYANAGGELVEPTGGSSTQRVHGYNDFWAGFILPPGEATVEPPLPPPPPAGQSTDQGRSEDALESDDERAQARPGRSPAAAPTRDGRRV